MNELKYKEILESITSQVGNFNAWKNLLHEFPLTKEVIDLLDGVPQGTIFHPEFDALKHTYYVCKASIADGDHSLIEVAFLHDVGKSTHTNIGRDRIYSYGHADASARFVEKHREHITDFEFTHRIVKQHMNEPKQFDTPLKFFGWADKIESKRLYKCDSSKIERFVNKFYKEKRVYLQQRWSRKKVILLVGISGSGKSTYIKDNFDMKYVVCPDDLRREAGDINDMHNMYQIWKLTKELMLGKLHTHGKVVLDATNVNKWLRIQFMANFNGCYKEAIYFPIEVEVAIARVNADIENKIDRSNVPESVIRKQFQLLHKGTRSMYNEFNKIKIISR